MSLKIGHAASNERGEILGGAKGDQTGREVRINTFFDGQTWQVVYRCTDAEKRKLIGKYMKDACENDHIGYDTGNTRYSCWNAAMAVKSTAGITEDCNTDCSQLMCICVNLAGIPLTRYLWTAIEDELLMSTGQFLRITDAETLRGNGLEVGDILWRTGHTAVVVEAEETKPGEYDHVPKWVGEAYGMKLIPVYKVAEVGEQLPAYPNLGTGNLFDVCEERGDFYLIRIAGQYFGFIEKRYCLRKTPYTTGTVTADLHFRQNAGTQYKSIAVMPKGTKFQIADSKKAATGVMWYYGIFNGSYGFASSRYIKA